MESPEKKITGTLPGLFMHARSQVDWQRFEDAICTAWEAITQSTINRLIGSMPRRLRHFITVKGVVCKVLGLRSKLMYVMPLGGALLWSYLIFNVLKGFA